MSYVINKEVDEYFTSIGFTKSELTTNFIDSNVYDDLNLGEECLVKEHSLESGDVLRIFISDPQIYCEIEGSWGGFYSLGYNLTILWQEDKNLTYVLKNFKSSLEEMKDFTNLDLVGSYFGELEESFVFEELRNFYGPVEIAKNLDGTFLKLGDHNAGDHFMAISKETYDLLKKDLEEFEKKQREERGW